MKQYDTSTETGDQKTQKYMQPQTPDSQHRPKTYTGKKNVSSGAGKTSCPPHKGGTRPF